MHKRKKRRVLAGLLSLLLCVSFLSGCSDKSSEEDVLTDEEFNEGKIANYEISWPELEEPYYRELRSGVAFAYKDGYTVKDTGDYLIVYNPDENGCLCVYSNMDCGTISDGTETFGCYYGYFNRSTLYLDGKEKQASMVDGTLEDGSDATLEERTIADRNTKVYTGSVYVGTDIYPGTYYCTVLNSNPFCVAQIGETSLTAEDILNSVGSATYAGAPITDHPDEQLVMTTVEYEGHTMEVPNAWDQIEGYKNTLVVRPPTCIGDTLSDCRIVFYESEDDFDSYFDVTFDFYGPLASCQMQNVKSNNHRKLVYVTNNITSTNINGKEFRKSSFETAVELADLTTGDTIPGRNISMLIYSTQGDDGKPISIAFCADTYKNREQMLNLAEELIETYN